MFDRLKRWFKGGGTPPPDPRTLVGNVVKHDSFDEKDYANATPNVPNFLTAKQRLSELSPAGAELCDDLFYSLLRPRPELADREDLPPRLHVNHQVLSEAMELADWRRLHKDTMNDPWFSAMAACGIARKIEPIIQRLQEQQDKADELQETMERLADARSERADLDQQLADLSPGDDDLQGNADDLDAKIEALLAQASEQGDNLDSSLAISVLDVMAAANDAVNEAADRVGGFKDMAALWGLDPGRFELMSAEEHMRLAAQLDDAELRELAKLIGSMKFDVMAARSSKVRYVPSEVYSVEQGNDLARLLPHELAKLRHPIRRREFFKGYMNRTLMQYKLRGEEHQGQGGIICEIDTSGSMTGQKMRHAKATSKLLLDIAEDEGRSFTGILFAGPGRFKTYHFAGPEDFTIERILEWMGASLGGGTDFETPMDEAIRILDAEYAADGKITGDIVLISDNECSVSDAWLEHYLSEQKRLDFRCYGVLIGRKARDWGNGMQALTDSKVYSLFDLFSAKELKPIYAAV